MLRNIFVQLYLFLQPLLGMGQSLEADAIASLPVDLNECSGMAFIGPNAIALINDSGNEAELFICDTLGQLIMRPKLLGLPNRDWESLAYQDGLLYIGDFGNNGNHRRDLEVLVLDVHRLLNHGEWSLKGRIPFSYPEQKGFPPEDKKDWYYDLEAMIATKDSLFLFTKNRSKPFDGELKVYGLSTESRAQKARLLKSFKTEIGLKHFNWVTGATAGPNGDDLFLLGYSKLWYIENWRNTDKREAYPYRLGYFSQKESLALMGHQLYFSEEKTANHEPQLHKLSVAMFKAEQQTARSEVIKLNKGQFSTGDTMWVSFNNPHLWLGLNFTIYATDGTLLKEAKLAAEEFKGQLYPIHLEGIPSGNYVISFKGRLKRALTFKVL